jgi:hypothetical protein
MLRILHEAVKEDPEVREALARLAELLLVVQDELQDAAHRFVTAGYAGCAVVPTELAAELAAELAEHRWPRM